MECLHAPDKEEMAEEKEEQRFPMSRERIREWSRPIYFLGQNPVTLTGAVVTTSTALTIIAFWFYDIFLPGPPHPYIGLLVYLILPGIFVLGLLLIPLGIWLRRRSLRGTGKLPEVFPPIDLRLPVFESGLVPAMIVTFGMLRRLFEFTVLPNAAGALNAPRSIAAIITMAK